MPYCAHQHRVSSSRAHNSNTRSNRNPRMTSSSKHPKTEPSDAAEAHKLTRKSHLSLPGNCTSFKSTIRLPVCAHQHRVSSSRAHNGNTRSYRNPRMTSSSKHPKTEPTTAAAAAHKLTSERTLRPTGNCTPRKSTIWFPLCAHRALCQQLTSNISD